MCNVIEKLKKNKKFKLKSKNFPHSKSIQKSDDDDEVTLYPTRWRTPSAAVDSQFVSGATPEASTTIGLHIKRLTRQHFGSGNQLTVVCTASSIGSAHRRSSAVKAVLDEGLSSRQGPLVNPLRPSTAAPTAAGDKRRSPQTSTGQSLIITRGGNSYSSLLTISHGSQPPPILA